MSDSNDDTTTEEVKRTDHGVSITTEIKRGTGTRDQDKHVIKSKGGTYDEAAYYHRQGVALITGDDPADVPLGDAIRNYQPEVDDEDDGERGE